MTNALSLSELSGLELRKRLAELLGWKWDRACLYSPDGKVYSPIGMAGELSAIEMAVYQVHVPAWESDPAVFWPAFEKWAKDQGTDWGVESRNGVVIIFTVYRPSQEYEAVSMDLLEAGCRAWVKALEHLKSLEQEGGK